MSRERAVFLVGFMGCGKTEVGRRVAARTGRPFVDLDERIVAAAGKSVPAIFTKDGEAASKGEVLTLARALTTGLLRAAPVD